MTAPPLAALFDMDGTLVDSEGQTEACVVELLRERGLIAGPNGDSGIDLLAFHGVTWTRGAQILVDAFPALPEADTVRAELQERFHKRLASFPPPVIPGAPEAVVAAGEHLRTAIVSSTNRPTIELIATQLQLREHLHDIVGAEDVQRSKPDPQGYVLAAERLGVAPGRCIVFEDSVAGLRAAGRAGMAPVAILHAKSEVAAEQARSLADYAITDFTELPARWWSSAPNAWPWP